MTAQETARPADGLKEKTKFLAAGKYETPTENTCHMGSLQYRNQLVKYQCFAFIMSNISVLHLYSHILSLYKQYVLSLVRNLLNVRFGFDQKYSHTLC